MQAATKIPAPARFRVTGIEPPSVRAAAAPDRLAYWRAVVTFGIEAKERELARGLDRRGKDLAALSPRTIAQRRSAMGPADPRAPALQPAHGLSRTRSLFTGEPTPDGCWFGWLVDPHTGKPWGKMLLIHRKGGKHLPRRDVVGLSPASLEEVKRKAAAWWLDYQAGRADVPEPDRPTFPGGRPRFLTRPAPKYAPKVPANAVPKSNAAVRSIDVNGDVYTLQGGSAAQIRRGIADGSFSGFRSRAERAAERVRLGLPPRGRTPTAPPRPPSAPTSAKPRPTPPRPEPRTSPKPEPPAPTPAPKLKPSSAALDVQDSLPKPIRKAVGDAARAIDSVHQLPDSVAPIPVARLNAKLGNWGRFEYSGSSGAPIAIKVSPKSPHPGMTLAHEFGHFLDVSVVRDDFGSRQPSRSFARDPRFTAWFDAVLASDGVKALQALDGRKVVKHVGADGVEVDAPVNAKYVAYVLGVKEVWARSYAQYIAVRSGDARLREELDAMGAEPTIYRTQWSDDDFAPIARAMDALFEDLGWRKPAVKP